MNYLICFWTRWLSTLRRRLHLYDDSEAVLPEHATNVATDKEPRLLWEVFHNFLYRYWLIIFKMKSYCQAIFIFWSFLYQFFLSLTLNINPIHKNPETKNFVRSHINKKIRQNVQSLMMIEKEHRQAVFLSLIEVGLGSSWFTCCPLALEYIFPPLVVGEWKDNGFSICNGKK